MEISLDFFCPLTHLFFCNDYTRKEQEKCVFKQTKTGAPLCAISVKCSLESWVVVHLVMS